MNEELIRRCLRMLQIRARYHQQQGHLEEASSYSSAAYMLEYAIDGSKEALDQYDYYEVNDDEE